MMFEPIYSWDVPECFSRLVFHIPLGGPSRTEAEHPKPGFGEVSCASLSLEQCLEDGQLTKYLRWFAMP